MKLAWESLHSQIKTLKTKAILLSAFEEDLIEPALSNLRKSCAEPDSLAPLALERHPASSFKSQGGQLIQSMVSPPLFGRAPLFVFENLTESMLPHFQAFQEKANAQNLPTFLITAGYLKTASATRQFFESSRDLVHCALTRPSPATLATTLKLFFEKQGATAAPELIQYLVLEFQDRMALIDTFLIPFTLTKQASHHFTLEDYQTYKNKDIGGEESLIESFLLNTLPADISDISKVASLSGSYTVTPIGFARLLNFHLSRLLMFVKNPDELKGLSQDQRNLYIKCKPLWTQRRILDAIALLNMIESSTKRGISTTLSDFWMQLSLLK